LCSLVKRRGHIKEKYIIRLRMLENGMLKRKLGAKRDRET
jgi:hypothetical protein